MDERRMSPRREQGPPIGFTPCMVQGFQVDEAFLRFMRSVPGGIPNIVQSFVRASWLDDEAIAWVNARVDSDDAQDWIELGVEPNEAAPLAARGQTAVQTVELYAAVGVPRDEIAQWVGAGLEPDEAAAQRARGIDSEHAAVLRSLRTA